MRMEPEWSKHGELMISDNMMYLFHKIGCFLQMPFRVILYLSQNSYVKVLDPFFYSTRPFFWGGTKSKVGRFPRWKCVASLPHLTTGSVVLPRLFLVTFRSPTLWIVGQSQVVYDKNSWKMPTTWKLFTHLSPKSPPLPLKTDGEKVAKWP